MKRTLYFALAVALMATACSKEMEQNPAEVSDAEENLPVWAIGATIENEDPVKAALDEETLQVLWQENDQIGLVDADGNITPATLNAADAGKASGTFTYTAAEPVAAVYAFYPYQETATVTGTTLNINLPQGQNQVIPGGIIQQSLLIMVAKASEGRLPFKNTCALAKVLVNGKENYARKAYLECPDFKLCGDGTVDLDADSPVFTLPAVNEITTSADNNRYLIGHINVPINSRRLHVTPEGEAQVVYFVVPPGSYTHLAVETLGNTDSSTKNAGDNVEFSYTSSKTIVFNAGKVRPLRVTLQDDAAAADLSPAGAYANSYQMVTGDADALYSFGAYKRDLKTSNTAYDTNFSNGYYASLVWQSTENLLSKVSYDFAAKRIYFQRSAGKTGNALVALRNRNGQIVWSWHIWVTPDAVEERSFNGTVLMDRNLGALSNAAPSGTEAEALGLHYQWGRKDPFPGAPDFSATGNRNRAGVYPDVVTCYAAQDGVEETFATQHPYAYVWGTANGSGAEDWINTQNNNRWGNAGSSYMKSSNDPCPYGWRVPSAANLGGSNTATGSFMAAVYGATIEHYGLTVSDDEGQATFVPCGGLWRRKEADTELANVGTYCNLWTMTSSTTNDVLNTDYFGAAMYYRYGASNSSMTRKVPHRWGAQIRCVKFDEGSYTK